MTYPLVCKATFLSRPNRFIANCRLETGKEVVCHVKNTGRCKELLLTGVTVWLAVYNTAGRKTGYDLIAVEKGGLLINMDSQAPNQAAEEFLSQRFPEWNLRREVVFGASRLDFCLTKGKEKIFVEVKGVTLEREGRAYFPDAPTERGLKHVEELIAVREAGYGAALLFVVQMKPVLSFSPNMETDPRFGARFADALHRARDCGAELLAYDCYVTPNSMKICDPVPVLLPDNEKNEGFCEFF